VDISLQVLLFVALLVLLARVMGGLAGRIGLPMVLGEIVAGIILGPTVLNIWRFHWFYSSASGDSSVSIAQVIRVLASLGVVVVMFLAGLETDAEMMKAAIGPASWAACGGVVLPFLGGMSLARAVGYEWREAVFIGAILTATSVAISAQTLANLGQLRSRPGTIILGSAVIDDVLGLVLLSVVIGIETHTSGGTSATGWLAVIESVGCMALFFGFTFLIGPSLISFVFSQVRHLHGEHSWVALALGIAFVFGYLAQSGGGMAAITGSYFAGLLIGRTTSVEKVIGDVRSMTNSFFGPLFFTSVGLDTNARQVGGHLGFFLMILTVAVLGKVLGCGIGARLKGLNLQESLVVGAGMIPRGEVELITASIGWSAGLISSPVYSLVVVLILVTTLIAPVLLRIFLPSRSSHASNDASPPLIAGLPGR